MTRFFTPFRMTIYLIRPITTQPHDRGGSIVITNEQGGASIPTEEEKAFRSIAAMIRGKSREGLLVSMEEICGESIGQTTGTEKSEVPGIDLPAALMEKMKADGDLRAIQDQEGRSRYYSSRFMSETYAKILIRKEGDPLVLIAETVRGELFPLFETDSCHDVLGRPVSPLSNGNFRLPSANHGGPAISRYSANGHVDRNMLSLFHPLAGPRSGFHALGMA